MQEKESIMVVRCELKILSLMMPNSYPRDGIFNPHLRTIKDFYSLKCLLHFLGILLYGKTILG